MANATRHLGSAVERQHCEATTDQDPISLSAVIHFPLNGFQNNSNNKSDGESRLQSSRISVIGMRKLLNGKCFLPLDQAVMGGCKFSMLIEFWDSLKLSLREKKKAQER